MKDNLIFFGKWKETSFGKSLSFLEGFGGAAGLPAWVEEIVEAGACAMFIDNAGEFGGRILGERTQINFI